MIKCPKSFFLCSGSWGSAFYIGAYKAMVKKWGYKKLKKCKFGGNSAGGLIALGIALGIKWERLEKIYLDLAKIAIEKGVIGKMSNYHQIALEKMLTHKNDYKKVNGKLFIGLNNFYKKFYVKNKWSCNQDLIECMHASFHIPYYCTYKKKIDNKIAIDGAIGKPYFKIDNETLIISCRCEKNQAHITCQPKLEYRDVIKPDLLKYKKIKNNGYVQTMNWDGIYKPLVKDKKGYHIQTMIYWLLRYSAEILLK